jgi:uncharacterized protein (TIGR02266 family)
LSDEHATEPDEQGAEHQGEEPQGAQPDDAQAAEALASEGQAEGGEYVADDATFSDLYEENPPGSAAEERYQPRYGVDLSVTVNSEHNFFAGAATNLSAGGIFIATPIVHPIGTQFHLTLHLPDKPRPVSGVGEVRWLRAASEEQNLPPGIGIMFMELEDDGFERIAEFIEQREPLPYDER